MSCTAAVAESPVAVFYCCVTSNLEMSCLKAAIYYCSRLCKLVESSSPGPPVQRHSGGTVTAVAFLSWGLASSWRPGQACSCSKDGMPRGKGPSLAWTLWPRHCPHSPIQKGLLSPPRVKVEMWTLFLMRGPANNCGQRMDSDECKIDTNYLWPFSLIVGSLFSTVAPGISR